VTTAAIYTRISDDATGQGLGVKRQEEDCRALAKKRGWKVGDVYTDNDLSAYNGKARPAYEAMLAAIRADEVGAVVAWHPDRLYRRLHDLEALIELAEQHGIELATVTAGEVDLNTACGRLNARLLGSVARFESEHKAERIRRKHLQLAQDGRPAWGIAIAWGYRWDSGAKNIRPEPRAAREVRQIFERFDQGWGLRAIANDLTDRGVVGLRGRTRWSNGAVAKILDHAVYAGWRHYNGERTEGQWEPIIDRELWERVYARRTVTRTPAPQNHKGKGSSTLSGLLVCSCGQPMYRSTVGNDWRSTYECARAAKRRQGDCRAGGVTAHRVEGYVARLFLERVSAPYAEHVQNAPLAALGASQTDAATLDDAEAELQQVEQKIERLTALVVESPGPVFAARFRRQAEALERRHAELERILAGRKAEEGFRRQRAEAITELRKRAADLPDVWTGATAAERNQMLRVVIESVRVLPTRPRLKEFIVTWA